MNVPWKYNGSTPCGNREYNGSILEVQWKYTGSPLEVQWKYTVSTAEVHRTYDGRAATTTLMHACTHTDTDTDTDTGGGSKCTSLHGDLLRIAIPLSVREDLSISLSGNKHMHMHAFPSRCQSRGSK